MQADQTLGLPTSSPQHDIPKNDNGQSINARWTAPFKKFNWLKVKNKALILLLHI